jgi:hypothetical protein
MQGVPDDRLLIHELINLHGHLCDEAQLDRLGEIFTDDVVYDVSALGGAPLLLPMPGVRSETPTRWPTT